MQIDLSYHTNKRSESVKEAINPIEEKKRLVHVDILRGIAILGIFLVNMSSFHMPILYIDGYDVWTTGSDRLLYMVSDIFAQTSFYPLFAFLFGFGAIILYERSAEKGMSFPVLFSRRMLFLLFIGCIHAFFIWHGDILITYAVLGFVFLLFYKVKGKTLLIVGSLLYMIPVMILSLLMVFMSLFFSEELATEATASYELVEQSQDVYQHGSFIEVTKQRMQDWYYVNNTVGLVMYLFFIFPFFLLGASFAKLRWLHEPSLHKRKLIVIAIVCFVVGLAIKWLPYVTVYHTGTTFIQDELGGPLLTFAYITGITLLVQKDSLRRLLHPLSYIGKMSMSNYLFQSIVCTLLFYSYGFGLYGQVSYTTSFILIFVIYGLQSLASYIWLKHYRFGPMEYVWRWFTYSKRSAMKRQGEKG